MSLPDNFNSNFDDISLSRTFKMVDGQLRVEDSLGPLAQSARTGGALAIGSVVESKYKVLALLGEGGMGVVYRALHLNLDKEIALKTFRSARIKPEAWSRFQREAVAISKLSHTNIIKVFDFGISDQNVPYYTMELLGGQSLADKLAQSPGGRLPLSDVVKTFSAVAAGLAHAHKHGTVHRDIKPANIFLEKSGAGQTVKIVDFGLAKLMQSQSLEGQQLTSDGLVFGSPLYMSPEQSLGQVTDERTDIYSFGCSLYQALVGKPPFVGDSVLHTVMMHQTNAAETLAAACARAENENEPGRSQIETEAQAQVTLPAVFFPERLEALMTRLLAKDPSKRMQTFEEVIDELSRVDVTQKSTISDKTNMPAPGGAAEYDQDQHQNAVTPYRALAVMLTMLVLAGVGALWINGLISQRAKSPDQAVSAKPAAVAPLQTIERVLSKESKIIPVEKFLRGTAHGARIFKFPVQEDGLGRLEWSGEVNAPARGEVRVPVGCGAMLTGGFYLFRHPELLRGFRPNDLIGLKCHNVWGLKQFSELGSVSQIYFLDANKTELNASNVHCLNVLTRLKKLHCTENEITGLDLAKLSMLGRLEEFDGGHLSNMRPVIDVFVRSQNMKILGVKDCGLNDDDFIEICKIKSLTVLSADYNDISLRAFSHVVELPKLAELNIVRTKLGPEIIAFLPKLKKLRNMRITTDTWPSADQVRLRKALPNCTIQAYTSKFTSDTDN